MAQDLASHLASLPVLRVYDRTQVGEFIAAVEQEMWHLHDLLEAAEARRVTALDELARRDAADRTSIDEILAEEVDLTTAIAHLEAEIAAIRASAADEEQRILAQAEADVAAIHEALAARVGPDGAPRGGSGEQ